MEDDAFWFEAGRAIRPYLPRLLSGQAKEFDRLLVNLLRDRDSQGIQDLIESKQYTESLQDWLAVYAEKHVPPDAAEVVERGGDGYQPAPGPGGVALAPPMYECPKDRLYVWYRIDPGEKIPECPDHSGTMLVRI